MLGPRGSGGDAAFGEKGAVHNEGEVLYQLQASPFGFCFSGIIILMPAYPETCARVVTLTAVHYYADIYIPTRTYFYFRFI